MVFVCLCLYCGGLVAILSSVAFVCAVTILWRSGGHLLQCGLCLCSDYCGGLVAVFSSVVFVCLCLYCGGLVAFFSSVVFVCAVTIVEVW